MGWTFIPFNLITLSIFGVFVFVGQALFYMASIINMTNCVEYNEYKRGERNEAVVSTLRPFMAKFADALKYGIVILVLTVSAVYGLSQNISTMEAQKGYFDRMETVSEQKAYLTALNQYRIEWQDVDKEDAQAVADFEKRLESDSVLGPRQIQSQYISALGDVAVASKSDNKVIAFVKDLDVNALSDDGAYVMLISGNAKDNGADFNAADNNFLKQGNLSMRIWLRMSVTALPILLISIALLIQHKKFVITEDYYDMMLAEIESRKSQDTGDQPQQEADQANDD